MTKRDCSQLGLFASVIGHVGDGNFHTAMFYDPQIPEQEASVARVVHDMIERALEMEGTVSGEHAIGIGKKVQFNYAMLTKNDMTHLYDAGLPRGRAGSRNHKRDALGQESSGSQVSS